MCIQVKNYTKKNTWKKNENDIDLKNPILVYVMLKILIRYAVKLPNDTK